MAVDERTRHELHQRLEHVLGVEAAASLMAHLPPTGWGDVVTREHLDLRLATLEARFDGMDNRLDALADRMLAAFRAELNQAVVVQSRLLIVALFTALAAVAGIVFGVVQFVP